MRVRLLAAAAIVAVALAMVGALAAAPPGRPGKPAGRAAAPRTAAPTVTPAPPSLPRSAINRQDRVDRAHAARESRALDDRPLLSELPLELGDVTIDVAGLTPDGRRALLELTGPNRRAAEAAYRQVLAALGDPGTAYETRWVP